MSERFKWNANNLAVYIVVTENKDKIYRGIRSRKSAWQQPAHTQTLAKNKMVV